MSGNRFPWRGAGWALLGLIVFAIRVPLHGAAYGQRSDARGQLLDSAGCKSAGRRGGTSSRPAGCRFPIDTPGDASSETPSRGRRRGSALSEADGGPRTSSPDKRQMLLASLTIFVLAMFVGFEVITKVPPTLHTPLDVGFERDQRHHDCGSVDRGGARVGVSLRSWGSWP